MNEVLDKARKGKVAARLMNNVSTSDKNAALLVIADALEANVERIVTANEADIARGRAGGIKESLVDRLALNDARVRAMADGLREVVALADPVGDELAQFTRPNGLLVRQVRVPLGLIGMIYEARPNVTVDAAGLCLKTGNAVLLRGGSAALSSNQTIVAVIQEALVGTSLPVDAVQLIEDADRSSVDQMLKLNGLIDVIIPRGGAALINNVVQNATVPVIETGAGICHTFVDASAQVAMAADIAFNAKVQRPSVCNSMETLLVHADFAKAHMAALLAKIVEANVELHADARAAALLPQAVRASDADWATEYNDYVLNVKVVDSLDEALAHIAQFGTMHSECIVTEDTANAARFLQEVDAAAVYHNASTRFTDGFEFGFGAEIGISTQKLHARGPMGLPALTSTKYIIKGDGQVRQ
jgi:glutamate-5-semialdehyde dehydrogenase